jgi:5'-nucleotidase
MLCDGRTTLENKLVIAISSRALFDLSDSHRVFEEQGSRRTPSTRSNTRMSPWSPARPFRWSRRCCASTQRSATSRASRWCCCRATAPIRAARVQLDPALRLAISRAAFCGGESPWRYINAFGCQLFLSSEAEDVRYALDCGVAAATLVSNKGANRGSDQLRFAFDGDAVLFSDEAERVYKTEGLEAFTASERAAARTPLSGGPFKSFLSALHRAAAGAAGGGCTDPHGAGDRALGAGARARDPHAARLEHPHRRVDLPRRPGQDRVPARLPGRRVLRRSAHALRVGA